LIIVTHDREFLDNVVSSILVFEDSGTIQNYAGGFSDWLKHGKHLAEMDNPVLAKDRKNKLDDTDKKRSNKRKLGYKLKLELDALPETIEILEREVAELEKQSHTKGFYSKPYAEQQPVLDELHAKHKGLDKAIQRWDELESFEKELQANK